MKGREKRWRDFNTYVSSIKILLASAAYKLENHAGKFITKTSTMWRQPWYLEKGNFHAGPSADRQNVLECSRSLSLGKKNHQKAGGERHAGVWIAAVSQHGWWPRCVLGQWEPVGEPHGKGFKAQNGVSWCEWHLTKIADSSGHNFFSTRENFGKCRCDMRTNHMIVLCGLGAGSGDWCGCVILGWRLALPS